MHNKHEAKREQSIEVIQQAALQLFAEHGIEKTTIRMIAAEAKIALGLLYNYFPSKEELLKSIINKFQQDTLGAFIGEQNQQQETVEFFIKRTIKNLKQNRKFYKLIHGIRLQSSVVKNLEKEQQEQNNKIQKLIEENFAEADIPFPALEAKLLLATLDGLTQQFLLQENYPLDDLTNVLIIKYREQKSRYSI